MLYQDSGCSRSSASFVDYGNVRRPRERSPRELVATWSCRSARGPEMPFTRRDLFTTAVAMGVGAVGPFGCGPARAQGRLDDWNAVRDLFNLSPDRVHMSTMLLTSHPAPVREAIDRHRSSLDADPVVYLEDNGESLTEASRGAAAGYLGMHPAHVALTDSTTMGIGLMYTSLGLGEGDEVLTTEEDY